MKSIFILFLLILFTNGTEDQNIKKENTYQIPIQGNTYIIEGNGGNITKQGIENWKDAKTRFSTYIHFQDPQKSVLIGMQLKGNGKFFVKINNQIKTVEIDSKDYKIIHLGEIKNLEKGYHQIEFFRENDDHNAIYSIREIIIENVTGKMHYVHDFSEYWGRRGASVHLFYPLPKNQKIEFFYNEVSVEKGDDVIGSYFMVNGFNFGYFGMQVNSKQERRILFSVWSPANVQNPKDIPEDKKIKCLASGKDVIVKEFGNEGAGGQSFLRFPWKSENKYKFLLKVHPEGDNSTVFTAYFYAPELNKWSLIASFKRPFTQTWCQGAHSFLENFSPNQGCLSRKVFFSNQWGRSVDGKWFEISEAHFSCDETGSRKVRLDYSGGLSTDQKSFILQNGGFTNLHTSPGQKFKRIKQKQEPEIDFDIIDSLTP